MPYRPPRRPLVLTLGAASCLSVLLAITPTIPASADDAPRPTGAVRVAGTGSVGYSGDGGPALDARLNDRLTIEVGPEGEVYVADRGNKRLRVISPGGTIETVEGTRGERSPETDGPDVDGWVFSPSETPASVALGPDGELYVASRSRIRRMDGEGEFTTVAGGEGEDGFRGEDDTGDGAQATDLAVYHPPDIDVDAEGALYYLDVGHRRVRKVAPDGEVSTVVGGGDDRIDRAETATDVGPFRPESMAVDSTGAVYLTVEDRSEVFRAGHDGSFGVAAGTGDAGFSGDGGAATQASLNLPYGLAVDADDRLLIADTYNGRVRRVDEDGVITTLGSGFGEPRDVEVGPDGDVYVAGNARVTRIVTDGSDAEGATMEAETGENPWAEASPGDVLSVAGVAHESEESPEFVTPTLPLELEGPRHYAVGSDGTVYASDTVRHRVLAVAPDGTVTTVAGSGDLEGGFSGDGGPAEDAELNEPRGLAVDAEGQLYIADTYNSRVRRVDTDGTIETFAGTGGEGAFTPHGLAIDPDGTLFFTDTNAGRVGAVDPEGTIETIAGEGDRYADEGDGHPAEEASLWEPGPIAADGAGNVYFTERGWPSVRRIDRDGVLTTIAGDSYLDEDEGGFSGDGGPAEDAELNEPRGLAVDVEGRLYIADTYNSRVRRVDTDGTIETFAGTGEPRDRGDGGPAEEAALAEPEGIAVGPDGEVVLGGPSGEAVRRVDSGTVSTLVTLPELRGDRVGASGAADEVELELARPGGLGVAADGTVYVADAGTGTIRAVDPESGELHTVTHRPPAAEGEEATDENTGEGARRPLEADVFTVARDGTIYYVARAGSGTVHRVRDGGPSEPVVGIGAGPAVGEAAQVSELAPTDLSVSTDGTLYIAEQGAILRLEDDGSLTTLAGGDPPAAEGWEFADDDVAEPEPVGPAVIAAAPDGGVYFSEDMGNLVRRVDPDGALTTVAGTDEDAWSEDDLRDHGTASETPMPGARALAVGDEGELYVSTTRAVHMVRPDGSFDTVMESRSLPDEDGEPLHEAATALALDDHGNLHLSQPTTNQVEVLVRPADSVTSVWVRAGVTLSVVVLLFLAAGAYLLRDELRTLARTPRRWPMAAVTVVVLLVAGVLDALGWVLGRFGR